jgi:biopolymer transport protein ExbD
MAKIERKTKVATEIPNASMSDIAFLLLIFFMVSTTFVKEKGLKVNLPQAEAIQKINRRNANHQSNKIYYAEEACCESRYSNLLPY